MLDVVRKPCSEHCHAYVVVAFAWQLCHFVYFQLCVALICVLLFSSEKVSDLRIVSDYIARLIRADIQIYRLVKIVKHHVIARARVYSLFYPHVLHFSVECAQVETTDSWLGRAVRLGSTELELIVVSCQV